MIPGAAFLFLIGSVVEHDPNGQWSLNYSVSTSGPVTDFAGFVSLNFSEDMTDPCFDYVFNHAKGDLFGPAKSSSPESPILPFDTVDYLGTATHVCWCETPSEYQSLPVQVPRFFNFSVIRTSFGPDDLARLLADWGGSTWDLNGDQVVDAADLGLLLQGWETSSGESS